MSSHSPAFGRNHYTCHYSGLHLSLHVAMQQRSANDVLLGLDVNIYPMVSRETGQSIAETKLLITKESYTNS